MRKYLDMVGRFVIYIWKNKCMYLYVCMDIGKDVGVYVFFYEILKF